METSTITRIGTRIREMLRQRLYQNAGYLLAANFLPGLIGFAFWALAGNLFGAEAVGLASVVFSAGTLLAMLANMGLSTGLIRFLGSAEDRPALLQTVFAANLAASLIFGGIYLAGTPLWAANLVAELHGAGFIAVFLALTAAITLGAIVRDTFVAYRAAKYAFAYTLVSQAARIVFLLMFIGGGAGGLVTSTMLAFALGLVFSAGLHLRRVEPEYRLTGKLNAGILKSLIPFSLGSHLTNLLLFVPQLVFPMMILEMLGPVPSAHAYIPLMLGWMITSPAVALLNSAFAESSHEQEQADRILLRTGALAVGISIVIGAAVYLLAGPLLSLVGSEYAAASKGLLRWLAVAAPFITFNQAYINYLRVYKKIRLMTVLNLALTAVIMALAATAIPRMGINGSGVSVLAAYLVATAVSAVILVRERRK